MASMYGGLLGGINQTNKTLTSILTISDGFTTMSGGDISGVQNISTGNISISGDLEAPELVTSSIQTQSGSLVIGDLNDSITIYGNEIKFFGNLIGYDSANIYIVDNRIELNAGGGNLLVPNSGISILSDGNLAVSNILTDNVGDWLITSPNNKLSVENLVCGNLTLTTPLTFDTLECANITATEKLITQGRAFLNTTTSYTTSTTHLNSTYVKASELNIGKGLRFLQQPSFVIDKGTFTGTTAGNYTITFNLPFISSPTCNVSFERNSSNHGIIWIISVSTTQLVVRVANSSNAVISPATIHWVAYGSI